MKKHLIIHVIIAYLVVVIISAFVNWLHFQKDSTSFLITERLNTRLERYEFKSPEHGLAIYLKNAKDSIPLTIEEFDSKVKPLFEKLSLIEDSLVFQREECDHDDIVLDSLTNIASIIRSDSIAVITKNAMAQYQRRIDEIERSMSGRDSIELTLEGKYVELAEAQVEFAQKNAELQSSIIEQYAFLIPSDLSDEILEMNNHYITSLISVQRLEMSRLNVYDGIKRLSASFHNNRIAKVSFFDFIYYSICVSTTVSFGDIAPNDSFTRALALIELLFCLLIVGYIVNYFAPTRGGKDN